MTRGPKQILDGFVNVSGGVDSGQSPTAATANNPDGLSTDKIAFLVNGTVRGGRIKPRPAYIRLPVDNFESNTNIYQGGGFYSYGDQDGAIIAMIGGRVWKFNVGTNMSVQEITIPGDPNPPNRPKAWAYQAENFFIIQDNQTRPFIYNGSSARRSNPSTKELPVGSVGVYGMGRIWQTLQSGDTFAGSNLVRGTTGQTSDILSFSDNDYYNESKYFSVTGQINAMRFPNVLNTALGQGPLQIFTSSAIYSINAPIDATIWKNLTYPIQTISMISYGSMSQNATILVNGDIYYRSPDGVRSFILAVREFGQFGNTPLSREMKRVIELDDKTLLGDSSAVVFDNRLLMTASPFHTPNGTAHRSLMSLDFDLVSGNGQKRPPAWEGIWTGLNVLQIIKGFVGGVERCFAFVSNNGLIELWELSLNSKFDNDGSGDIRIEMQIEGASYPFGTIFDLKRLIGGELWIDNLVGTVNFNVEYRPDQYPCYLPWQDWSDCAAYQVCNVDLATCQVPKMPAPQYRPKKKLGSPPESCNTILGSLYKDMFECQPRITITGYCEVKQFRLRATDQEETVYENCK